MSKKVKNIDNKKRDHINVLMFGARRTGKTSVLASMMESFKNVNNVVNFYPDDSTEPRMKQKICEMNDTFSIYRKKGEYTDGMRPDEGIKRYKFSVTMTKGERLPYINFIDIYGELLVTRDENKIKELTEYINEADIIILSVDTPCLVENNGKYFEACHKIDILYNFLVNSNFTNNGQRMVLIMPLKCEAYKDRMDEVLRCVEAGCDPNNEIKQVGFGKIIDLLKENDNITLAVTPIFTMGQLYFHHFQMDDNDDVVVIMGKPIPVYHFSNGDKSEREPRFCHQPLLYIIAWLYGLCMQNKNADSQTLDKFKNIMLKISKYTTGIIGYLALRNIELNESVLLPLYNNNIIQQIKTNGDGYKVIKDPMKVLER